MACSASCWASLNFRREMSAIVLKIKPSGERLGGDDLLCGLEQGDDSPGALPPQPGSAARRSCRDESYRLTPFRFRATVIVLLGEGETELIMGDGVVGINAQCGLRCVPRLRSGRFDEAASRP